LYRQYRSMGLSESQALERTVSEVGDWRSLSKAIGSARQGPFTFTPRTGQIWLPGLVSILSALVLPSLLFRAAVSLGPLTRVMFSGQHRFTTAWLIDCLAFGLSGALGAFLSLRFGGGRLARLASGLFPVALLLAEISAIKAASDASILLLHPWL